MKPEAPVLNPEACYTASTLDPLVAEISERMATNLMLVIRDLAEAVYFLKHDAQALAGVRMKHAREVLEHVATWEEHEVRHV